MKSLSYPVIARNASRGLLLGSLVYSVWRYGGTDPDVMVHLAIALAIATGLVLSTARRALQPSPLPKPYFALILIWVLYAFAQAALSPNLFPWVHRGVAETRQTLELAPVAMLDAASQSPRLDIDVATTASVIPSETLTSVIPFLLAFALAVLAAILFDTRRSRRFFLWTVVVNASLLACWGLIQRAGGGNQILPGIDNTFANSMPFGSFIYKNAGAAALLPAMPAVAVIWWSMNRRDRSSGYASESRFAFLLDVRKLSLTCLSVLLIVGLLASLSRGAWIAAGVTAIALGSAAAWVYRRKRSSNAYNQRQTAWVAGSAVVTMIIVAAVTGIGMSVRERAEQISIENVSLDQRWAHWRDGFATAWAHFPSGSGLGTYGYATLAHQTQTHRSWFREAHNQYLEVFTESGLIGLAVLLVAMWWLLSVSVGLIRRDVGREKQGWGWIGLSLLIAGGLQSMIDFVLVIPANMFLYASLIGIVGATERRTRPPITTDSKSRGRIRQAFESIASWQRRPVFHLVTSLLLLFTAYYLATEEVAHNAVISATELAGDEQPSEHEVMQSLSMLNDAIAAQPHRSRLYLRRAHWRLAEYRLAVVESAREEGTSLGWQDTAIENIFVAISRMPPEAGERLRQGLRETPEMNRRLQQAMGDIAMSLRCNPLEPDTHLLGAMLAPLTEMPVAPWLHQAARLSNNSSQKLYCNGVLAFHAGETELATDQWARSIAVGHEYLRPILDLAKQKLDAAEIVARLVPDTRPDLALTLIVANDSDGNVEIDPRVTQRVLGQLRNGDRFDPALKHATIARMEDLVGAHDRAVGHWETALRLNTRDAGYRLEYSQSLHQLGRHQEALRQAVLGQTLYPVDRRFKHLAARIRRASRDTRQE